MILILLEGEGEDFSHFTSAENLKKILASGLLLGTNAQKQYSISSISKKKNSGYDEICVIRSGIANTKIDKGSLSKNANGGIRIMLKKDYVQRIRNVGKPVPIAEYAIYYNKKIKSIVEEIKKEYTNKNFLNDLNKTIANLSKKQMIELTMNKKYDLSDNVKRNMYLAANYLKDLKNISNNREGEERFIISSGKGIPVSSKYMRIRIDNIENIDENLKSLIKKYSLKDPDLFDDNSLYNSIIQENKYFNY